MKATREDWLNAALDTLVSDGIEQVRILALSDKLGVSRSSFYWYFKSRRELLDALIDHWEATNTKAVIEHASLPSRSITEAVCLLFHCWVDERLFSTQLDFAIREWARRSGTVRHIVDRSDDQRITAISDMFLRHGFEAREALVRARIIYFMQLGYYALELREPLATRYSFVPLYVKSFTGVDPSQDEVAALGDFMRHVVKETTGRDLKL